MTPRYRRLAIQWVVMAATLAAAVGTARAQQQDSTKAGVPTRHQRPVVPRDSIPKPPIAPGRAFLYSLLLPGLGQAKLDRPTLAAFFFTIEVISIVQARQAAIDLAYAHRHHGDSAVSRDSVINGKVQIDTSTGKPIEIFAYNPYSSDRVNARGVHFEDWIAAIVFNHLISGADAFVAANLWDLPTRVTASHDPQTGTTSVAIRVAWQVPPL
jgi:hypothetical protein